MLSKFHLAVFKLHYVPVETVYLPPYKGAVLRGGLGNELKKTTCVVKGQPCEGCILKKACVYYQIFETPVPENSVYFGGQSKAPHPFVIEPPEEYKTKYSPYDRFSFNLILIGDAVDYLPYFVLAFWKLGRRGIGRKISGERGKCLLEKVESLKSLDDDRPELIFSGESEKFFDNVTLIKAEDIFRDRDVAGDKITLDFITPTRIKQRGSLQDKIDFEMLIRNLLRRILALSYFHCGEELKLDYKSLIEKASKVRTVESNLRWHDWSRYSRRQDTRISLGGFKGRITFEGKIEEFLPLILLGEYVHIGKGTAFGLGKFRIITHRAHHHRRHAS